MPPARARRTDVRPRTRQARVPRSSSTLRVREAQRRHREEPFAADPERFPAGHQHPQVGAPLARDPRRRRPTSMTCSRLSSTSSKRRVLRCSLSASSGCWWLVPVQTHHSKDRFEHGIHVSTPVRGPRSRGRLPIARPGRLRPEEPDVVFPMPPGPVSVSSRTVGVFRSSRMARSSAIPPDELGALRRQVVRPLTEGCQRRELGSRASDGQPGRCARASSDP